MTTRILGTQVDCFHVNDSMRVRFRLNDTDPEAIERNHKASLQMLSNASLDTAPDRLFPNVVVVTAGAAIMIDVQCRSTVGFGYRITTGAETIADRLYAVGQQDEYSCRTSTVRRYQQDDHLITIQRMKSKLTDWQGRDELEKLWHCDIDAWEVHQFLDPVTSNVHNAKRPRFASPSNALLMRSLALADGESVQSEFPVRYGVVWPEGTSRQAFERITVQQEADRNSAFIGRLRTQFFVIDNE